MPETEDRAGPAGQQPHGAPNNETFMSNSSPRPVPAQPLGSWLSLIGTILTMLLVPKGSLTRRKAGGEERLVWGNIMAWRSPRGAVKGAFGRERPWTVRGLQLPGILRRGGMI